MAQYRQINTRSPFYVQLPTAQPRIELNLKVWSGDVVTDKPATPTYTLEKEAIGGEATFEISELVRDFNSQTEAYNSGAVWVETSLNDFVLAATSTIYLATEGYTLYKDGIQHNGNSWQTDYCMLPEDVDGNYRLTGANLISSKFQVLVNSQDVTTALTGTIEVTNTSVSVIGTSTLFTTELSVGNSITIAGVDYTVGSIVGDTLLFLTVAYAGATASGLSIIRNDYNWFYTTTNTSGVTSAPTIIAPTSLSSEMLKTYPMSNTFNRYDFNLDGEIFTVYRDTFDCHKYNNDDTLAASYLSGLARPITLHYINKFGAKNTFNFTLKHTEEISSSSDTFNRNVMNYSALNSGNSLHASRKRLTGSKQSFTINTDYIKEYYVKQLEELILSEYVWASIPHISTNLLPVNLEDKKIEKKNHLNDGLLQYTFNIVTASEYINTVR